MRYSAGREKEAAEYIERAIKTVNKALEGPELSAMDRMVYLRFAQELNEDLVKIYGDLAIKINEDTVELFNAEIDFNGGFLSQLLQENITVPSSIAAQSAVFAGVIGLTGATIGGALQAFAYNKIFQVNQQLTDAVTLRSSNEELVGRMNQLNPLQKRQAGTLIQTLVTHASVQARDIVLRNNESLFDGYEWVSVLDSRTSLICASRDGKIYPFSDDPQKSPKPPAHFSCRSTITPRVRAGMEDRVAKRKGRPAEGAKGTTMTRATTTYESWLKRQPAWFQDDVLGVTRGKLFRRGDLSIGRFVDDRGKTLTLDELRRLEPFAFEKANLGA